MTVVRDVRLAMNWLDTVMTPRRDGAVPEVRMSLISGCRLLLMSSCRSAFSWSLFFSRQPLVS